MLGHPQCIQTAPHMKNALMSYGSSDKGSLEGKVLLDKIVTVNGKEYKHKKITK